MRILLPLSCLVLSTPIASPAAARTVVKTVESACPTFAATGEAPPEASQRCIEMLRLRVAELEREAAAGEEELRRYRIGLDAAVAELNRLRPRRYDPRPPVRRTSARLDPTTERLGSIASVVLEGRTAIVRGTLRNGVSRSVEGVLVVELLRAGDPVAEVRYEWEIPAHSQRDYEQRFELSGYVAGIYSARAWIEY